MKGFNRYIVECKLVLTKFIKHIHVRFNRYIVECKSVNRVLDYNDIDGFNRYIVECKSNSVGSIIKAYYSI